MTDVGNAIDRVLRRLYENHRRRYMFAGFWLAAVVLLPLSVLGVTLLADLYAPRSSTASLPVVAAFISAALYSVAFYVHFRYERPNAAIVAAWWRAGRPSSQAVRVWTAVTGFPRQVARTLATLGLGLALATAAAIGVVHGLSPTEVVASEWLAIVYALWVSVVWFFVTDLIMRPVQLDAAAHLPRGFSPPDPGGVSFRRRVFGAIMVTATLAASCGAFVTDRGRSSVGALIGPVLAATILALAFGLVLTVAAARSILQPVDDLIAATRRVRAGDLSAPAPVTSDDELGALASSFNDMTAELQASREQLVTAREEERRRLRRDLHDGLGPTLAGIAMRLETARGRLATDPSGVDPLLSQLRIDTVELIADIRRLVHGLRPPQLDELGLLAAIRERATVIAPGGLNGGLRVTVEAPDELPPLSAALEVATYRIAEEALTNVVRHAGAHSCHVRIEVSDALTLEVRDDGTGLDHRGPAGVGLSSMRERAAELGGTCGVETAAEGGTRVLASLPLPD